MKKISMILAAAAAVVMTSCGGSAPKASLENDVDTVCYGMGVSDGENISRQVFNTEQGGMGVDSAYVDELIKGILDAANASDDAKKKAYFTGVALGNQIGNQIDQYLRYTIYGPNADSTAVVSKNDFIAGLVSALKGDQNALNLSTEDLQKTLQQKLENIKKENMKKLYGEYEKQNQAYMTKIAKADSVKQLGQGVCYKELVKGTGAIPTTEDRVKVHYEGKTIDGNIFDSSYKRGEPVEFGVTQVIAGWTEALTHMPVGSKWVVYIPAEAGYGAQEGGPIKPFSTLIFTVELLDIVK